MEIKELEEKLSAFLSDNGYDLVSLTKTFSKGENVIEVIIDRVLPIDMEAITEASHLINDYFDALDPFSYSYTLDISSLGAEKPISLDKIDLYVGQYINVHLINPIDGENIYEGELIGSTEKNISLKYRIKTRIKIIDIEKANISKIRLAIKF